MLVIVCPGQGSQTPGFLAPWLELPIFRERLESLSDVAGLDLVAHGTTSDAETIKDTAVAQPLIVAAGLAAVPTLFPQDDDLGASVGASAGHSVGEITAAALAGVLTDADAMAFVRERGRGMAAASAVAPTGMSAVLGGDPAEVGADPRAPRADRSQRQRRRSGRRRRHGRAAGGTLGRSARQGAGDPPPGRGGVPHGAHGAGRRGPRRAGPRLHDQRPPACPWSPTPTARCCGTAPTSLPGWSAR